MAATTITATDNRFINDFFEDLLQLTQELEHFTHDNNVIMIERVDKALTGLYLLWYNFPHCHELKTLSSYFIYLSRNYRDRLIILQILIAWWL